MSKPRKFDKTKVIQRGKNESMKLLVFMIFALTIVITPAFAELDLSNEKITSADNRLILQFTENTIKQFRTYTSIIPHIEYGIVDLGNVELTLDDARVNVFGDSFTIKNNYMALYANNIGNDKFRINTYINTNTGLQKNTFIASISIQPTTELEIIPQNPVIIEEKTEIHYLLAQHDRVYNNAEYKFFVKTFDKSIYSGNNFDNFEGVLSGVKVSAIIIDPNGEFKTELSGFSENGIFEGAVLVPENLWMRGWYTVDMVIEYDEKFYHEQLTFYVYGQVALTDSFSCPPGTSKVNGVCV